MRTIAWEMTAEIAQEFFQRCMDRKAETEKERIKILIELAEEGKMKSVSATDKTKEEYIRDKSKHFRILKVGKNEAK